MARRVLHIGPSETRGGMGSSIRRMCRNPPEGWLADSIPTHADGNFLKILNAWRIGRRRFARLIQENPPDLIHIHAATRFSWLRKRVCIHIAQKNRIPTIVHLHSGDFDRFTKSWFGWPRKSLCNELKKASIYPVVLTQRWKNWIEDIGIENAHVMSNPYRDDILHTSSEKRDCSRLLMIGRGSRSKGHRIAIDAVNQLNKLGINVHLDIIGPSQEELPKIGDRITVHGWVERNQLDRISAKAGMLLMPSTHEGMPLVVLDALASGLPCLVSATSKEFIGEGGKVIESLESTEWADTIQSIIENDDVWEKMCNHAPMAVHGLDAESDRNRWGKFYDSIMKSDSQLMH